MSAEPAIAAGDPQRPDAALVARAARTLAEGRLVVLPTDTVYGLACRADDEAAVRRLFAVKRRSQEKALPLLLPEAGALTEVAAEVSAAARKLAEVFWPGPLTLVVRKAPLIPALVTGGRDTVGVRVPDLPLTQAILASCDFPVAVTSANLADQSPATAVAELPEALRQRVALIVDAGRCPGQRASTVLDVSVAPPVVLREGPVTAEQIAKALGV
jgi:L-threonylcarbamoyladenylate synthase